MALYRDHGIVLRTHKLGEADRIIAFYTAGHGKVRAVAKGVRKTKSKFGARLEPTSHVAAQFYEGRNLDIVTQVETVDHFRTIREDLDRFARASAMLEAVDQVSEDAPPSAALYQLLLVWGVIPESAQPCRVGVSCKDVQIEWLGFVSIPLLSFVAFTFMCVLLVGAHRRSHR